MQGRFYKERIAELELALKSIRAYARLEQEQPTGLHMTCLSLIEKQATMALAGSETYDAELQEAMASLTKREKEIMTRLVKGYLNKEIASELNVSEKTIKHYLGAIFEKLGVRNRVEAVLALKSGAAVLKNG